MSPFSININFTSQPPRTGSTISMWKSLGSRNVPFTSCNTRRLQQHWEQNAAPRLPFCALTTRSSNVTPLYFNSSQKSIFDHYFCFFSQWVIFFDSKLQHNWQPQMPLDMERCSTTGLNIWTGPPRAWWNGPLHLIHGELWFKASEDVSFLNPRTSQSSSNRSAAQNWRTIGTSC